MDIDQHKIRALAEFRGALRKFLAFSEEAIGGAGITSQQYQTLLAIGGAEDGAIAIGALAQEMLIKPNAMVQFVDRLSAMGLVARERSDANRRSVNVALSAEGRALLGTLAAAHLGQLAKRRKHIADILRRLRLLLPERVPE
jgi:DNA-binding MarR family transcriptional regulator